MQSSVRFSTAVHILMCAEIYKNEKKVTSDFIAQSAGTNPVVIRKLMGKLNDAGMIESAQGTGGIRLLRTPEQITLKDIFYAVETEDELFKIHRPEEPEDKVAGNIERVLGQSFGRIQRDMDAAMDNMTLRRLLNDLERNPRSKREPSYILL